jgi:epsilon-lactone hydrolase
VAAYRWLLAQGADPRRVALTGDSAGGGLAFATMLRLRDEGVDLPAAAVVVSPWTDLALTGESLRLPVELAPRVVDLCLAGADPRNPYASPRYGDPTGLPPTLILVGGDDVLRDEPPRSGQADRACVDLVPRQDAECLNERRNDHRSIHAEERFGAQVRRKALYGN